MMWNAKNGTVPIGDNLNEEGLENCIRATVMLIDALDE